MGCLSGCLVSSTNIQKLYCGSCSVFKWSFDEFVGDTVISPSYSSTVFHNFLSFLIFNFKPAFSLSPFTFIKRLFSSSSLSAIRVVSSVYLRLLIFLLEIWFQLELCPSSAFHMMYSTYSLINQGDNITVQFSRLVIPESLWLHGLQHARFPCPSPTPRDYSSSCPLSRWCHPTNSSYVVPFFSHLQSFPASGSFPMSQFFASGSQIIGISASGSVLPMNIQDWFLLGLIFWISLQSKGLSRFFSNTTV